MPRLNVTRVLFSREFVDRTLVCRRNAQTVGQDGRAVDTPTDTPFSGVVTNDQGDIMKRMPEGSYVTGSISLAHTDRHPDDGSRVGSCVPPWSACTSASTWWTSCSPKRTGQSRSSL